MNQSNNILPPMKEEGRPDRAIARTIYFASTADYQRMMEICNRHPRSSVSSIISQLVVTFLAAYDAQVKPGDAMPAVSMAESNGKVYL
jgi:hypothetical protein